MRAPSHATRREPETSIISRSFERINSSFERQKENRRIRFSEARRLAVTLKPGDCDVYINSIMNDDVVNVMNKQNIEASEKFY